MSFSAGRTPSKRRCRRRNRSPVFLTVLLTLLHRSLQFSLVISKQSVNLVVGFVADRMNLRSKIPPRRCRILIEQRLNSMLMLLKQMPDLQLLLGSQLRPLRREHPEPGCG